MGLAEKIRLDQRVVESGLAENVQKARALILGGRVRAAGLRHLKAGQPVSRDQPVALLETSPFVSRGGLKLQSALGHFALEVRGRRCVDIGASTGGFTDCLLKAGAAAVWAVDVGHGQLDWTLRRDPRVLNRERTHVLHLTRGEVRAFFGDGAAAGLVTVDVSFISLENILPHLGEILPGKTDVVALVKPQFEVGPKEAPRGVVRDPEVHRRVRERVRGRGGGAGFSWVGECDSPLLGPEGNREFLFHFRRD